MHRPLLGTVTFRSDPTTRGRRVPLSFDVNLTSMAVLTG